jgi:SOS response regulatory protein OraA/RecX
VRLLRAELRQHGVESTSVQAATEQLAPSAEDDAYRAASKRAQQLQDADARVFQAKLGQFLARRGFEWATVASVVERLTRERADRRDPAALETEAQ